MFHAIAVIPKTTTPITAVFAFQLAGCAYHPPAGDQTCLGYLEMGEPSEQKGVWRVIGSLNRCVTHGIFPPLECETAAPVDLIDGSFSIARGNWISLIRSMTWTPRMKRRCGRCSKALALGLIDKIIFR